MKLPKTKTTVALLVTGLIAGLVLGIAIGYGIGHTVSVRKDITKFDECVAAGYPVQESYPARCLGFEQSTPQDQAITLSGRVVCLPHKNTDGPQTLECATGLKTDDGRHYNLRVDSSSYELASSAGSDRRVRVSGMVKKQDDTKYQSEGVITVVSFEFL